MVLIDLMPLVAEKGGKKPQPSDPPPDTSSALLELANGLNIVTAQPDSGGSLRVWTPEGRGLSPIWALEDTNFSSVAVGDIDGDGTLEIVAPGVCAYGRHDPNAGNYGIFINAYRDGGEYPTQADVWESSYGLEDGTVIDTVAWQNLVRLADLDGDGGDEVVLLTSKFLAVFKWDPEGDGSDRVYETTGRIKKVTEVRLDDFLPSDSDAGDSLIWQGMALGDVDGDESPDIAVTVRHHSAASQTNTESYLLVFTDPPESLSAPVVSSALGGVQLLNDAVGIGDVDGDLAAATEVWALGWDPAESGSTKLYRWDLTEGNLAVASASIVTGQSAESPGKLAVGELNDDGRAEVVVALRDPNEIRVYGNATAGSGEAIATKSVSEDSAVVVINSLVVDDGLIIAAGAYSQPPTKGKPGSPSILYVEGFTLSGASLNSQWQLAGGPGGGAWDVAVADK